MVNRLNSDTAFRVRRTLDDLTSRVAAFQQRMQAGYDVQVAAAVAEARAKVPKHQAVSDEELRATARRTVRRAWLDELQRTHGELKEQAQRARDLVTMITREVRVLSLPAPAQGATTDQRIEFGINLLNLRLEFPRETTLSELWDAFIAADENGDTMRAGYLENLIESQLAHEQPSSATNTQDVMRTKRERDMVRQQLEARRDRRPTENDLGNLTAWDRELRALEAHLSAAHQAFIAHARAA